MVRYMPNARFATKCSVLKAGMELHAYTDTVVLKIGRMMKNNSQFLMSSLVLKQTQKTRLHQRLELVLLHKQRGESWFAKVGEERGRRNF
jgi:hypothetical protein